MCSEFGARGKDNGVSTATAGEMHQFIPRQRVISKGSQSLSPLCTQLCECQIPGPFVSFCLENGVDLYNFLSLKQGICSVGGVEDLNRRIK